jgi:cyclase
VAVLVTDAGLVLVDTKNPDWGQAMLDTIKKKVSDKPIAMIINTHYHADHAGNACCGDKIEFVAHENTATYMRTCCNGLFQGTGEKLLPSKTFKDRMTIGSGRSQIDLYHFGRGHTDGDAVVVFPALGVAHAGDMLPWWDAPFCDNAATAGGFGGKMVAHAGGSCNQFGETLAKMLADLPSNIDTFLGGHRPTLQSRNDVQTFQEFVSEITVSARGSQAEGKSVDEAVAAIVPSITAKYKGYQTNRVKQFVASIYDELKK